MLCSVSTSSGPAGSVPPSSAGVSEANAVVSAAVSVPLSAPKAGKQAVTDESIIVKAQAMVVNFFFILFILPFLLILFLLEKECEDRCL